MHWSDSGIVLSARKYGENSAIIRIFAREHGVHAGVVKGASSKANRGIYQPGNHVNASWNARLSEQLGMFKAELLTPHAARAMQDGAKLAALSSACTLFETALPERHPYAKLYSELDGFLAALGGDYWQEAYVKLEMALLAETGFGLDLSRCAATGSTEELIYVSPKSGRAVSREAGEPYKDRLLKLPSFLQLHNKKNSLDSAEILAGMELTGYFLGSWLLTPHNRKLPAARARLMNSIKELHGETC